MLNFLWIMRNTIRFGRVRAQHQQCDLKTTLCSRQKFNHMLISCQGAMLKMRLARDLDAPLDLSECGSDY